MPVTWEAVAVKHGMGTTTFPYRPHGTDKANHGYIEHYQRILGRRRVRRLLEIGVQSGASLVMWAELLPDAAIHGIDINPCPAEGRWTFIQADAGDPDQDFWPGTMFDVIIDDGSHLAAHTEANLDAWASRLTDDGLYVIEDAVIGSTSWIQSLDEVIAMLPQHGLTPLAVERSRVPWVAHQQYGGMMSIVFADKQCDIP